MQKEQHTQVIILLSILIAVDMLVIGGILWKGHANFIEVYKHLKT